MAKGNGKLVLQPEIWEIPIPELENRIAAIRERRIVAAMEYAASKSMQLEMDKDMVHRKLKAQYEMLGKELERGERVIYALEERLYKITQLKDEAGLLEDM
jgi:hypothetical protein